VNEEALAHWGLLRQKKERKKNLNKHCLLFRDPLLNIILEL
jgi:hypothetical protein